MFHLMLHFLAFCCKVQLFQKDVQMLLCDDLILRMSAKKKKV